MLSPEQLVILKADIEGDVVLDAKPMSNAGADEIKEVYNTIADPAYYVWKPATNTSDLLNAIDWEKMIPVEAPDGTELWANQNLLCQLKQRILQIILVGQNSIQSDRANIRDGIENALTGLPTGASGANQNAGWTAVETAMKRLATRGEKLFATGSGTSGSPSLLGFEGLITQDDVTTAREMS